MLWLVSLLLVAFTALLLINGLQESDSISDSISEMEKVDILASIQPVDCLVSCSFFTSGSKQLTAGNLYNIVRIETNFKVEFEYKPLSIGNYPKIGNIFDLRDSVTGESLVYVSMPWTTNSVLGYGGRMLEQWGPNLVSNYQSAYTKFTIVVKNGQISIASSNDPNWYDTFTIMNINTAGRSYNLYLSNPNTGGNSVCAGGYVRNFVISGSTTVRTVKMPTTNCKSGCSLLTNGNTLSVRADQTFAAVSLTTSFTLSFEYKGAVLGEYPKISNIMDFVDCSSGNSLLAISLPWTKNSVVDYNTQTIEQWGPELVSNYQSEYTTFTIQVAAGKVTITSSSNPNWHDVKSVSTSVSTVNRIFYLYLSNPFLDFNSPNHNENRPSAQGIIRNIIITGKSHSV